MNSMSSYARPLLLVAFAGTSALVGCRSAQTAEALDRVDPSELHTTAAKFKPRTKAAAQSATKSLDDVAEESTDAAPQDSAMAKAAAGLQKALKQNPDTANTDSMLAHARTIAAKPKPTADKPRTPKVYPAPPVPVADASNEEAPAVKLEPLPIERVNVQPAAARTEITPDEAAIFAPAPELSRKPVATATPRVAPNPIAQPAPGVLTINAASICSRVESYGRFTPLDTSGIRAGRVTPILIYTEYDGFRHRTSAGLPAPEFAEANGRESDTEWVVEISQKVTIYGSDNLLKLDIPEQTARDKAKRRRRDHFLVQRIDLPATLKPGSYTIKITSYDRANPDYVVEQNLPFTVVAGGVASR